MKNFPVTIVPASSGELVSVYESAPELGFMRVEQKVVEVKNGSVTLKKRSAIVTGQAEALEILAEIGLSGKIVVEEYIESEIPAHLIKRFFSSKKTREENVMTFAKRAGDNGPLVMCGDERIVKFQIYTDDLNAKDIFVQHTNGDVLSQAALARRAATAKLDGVKSPASEEQSPF